MTWPAHPLLWVGLAAWAGGAATWAMAALGSPSAAPAGLGAGAVVLGGAAWRRVDSIRSAAPVALVCCGLLAGAVAVSGHLAATRPAALRAVSDGVRVELVATVAAASDGERAVVRVASLAIERELLRPRARALLIDRGGALSGLPRGAVVQVVGELLPLQPWREPGIVVVVRDVVSRAPPTGADAWSAELRERMWRALDGRDGEASSLIAGLAVGDDSRQSAGLGSAMRDSGLAHLTAVSGGNVAILAAAVLGTAAALGAGLVARVLLALLAVLAYAWFVGPEPSVLRATAMGCVALLGVLRGTRGSSPSALGLAVLMLVALAPGLVISWGFALSVAATAAILVLAPRWDRWTAPALARCPTWVAAAVALCGVTMAAHMATAPLLAAMTGQVSLVGPLANLLAAPLVVPITLGGLGVLLGSAVDPRLGALAAGLAEPFGAALARIARWAEDVPCATVEVGAATMARACLALLIAAGGLGMMQRWRGRRAARASPRR